MAQPRVDALLYDFGGVLVDIHFDRMIARWAELAGVEPAVLRPRFTLEGAYQAHERGEIDTPAYFEAMRGELGVTLDDAALLDGWNAIFGEPIAPTVELMHALAPMMPQFLLSNTNAMHYDVWSRRYADLLAPLREQFASHLIGLRKPDRAAFDHVVRAIGVPAGRILFFDDTEVNVVGAREAGLQAVHVRSSEDVARALAPWLGDSRKPA